MKKEHNKQIVPEILFEISRSKFVVVDITYRIMELIMKLDMRKHWEKK